MNMPPLETHDGRLVVPPILRTPVRRGVYMRPPFATSRSVNGPASDVKHGGQLRPTKIALPDEPDVVVGQFACANSHTQAVGPVQPLIRVVFLWGCPTQVIQAVVSWVSIIVSRLVNITRRRADENHKDKAVRQFSTPLPASEKANIPMAERVNALFAQTRLPVARRCHISAESAKRTDRVSIGTRNRFPNLPWEGINFISHSAVPSRDWSGPHGVGSTIAARNFIAESWFVRKGNGYAPAAN